MKPEIINIQITTVAFSLFFLLLSWVEVKRLKSVITPFVVAAIPFIIILLLVNFVLIDFQFPPVTMRSQLFIASCLFLVWLSGFVVSGLFKNISPSINKIFFKFAEEFNRFDMVLIIIAWIIAFIILHKAIVLFKQHGGFAYFGNQEYENEMIVGVVAHLVQLGKVVFIFLIFIFNKSKHKFLMFVTLFLLGIAIASIQVKYHIMFVIFIAFLFYNIGKPVKNQIKILAISALALFLIMNIFWFTLTIAWGTFGFSKAGVWEFFFKQTLNYFVTGPMVLDTWLSHPAIKPDWTLLVVVLNFYYFITGSLVRISAVPLVNMYFQQTAPGLYSNVGTAYGVYYLIGGLPLTFAMVIMVSILSYVFYFKSIRSYSPYLIFLNLLFLTMGVLSFFVQYFTLLSTYEAIVLFFALVIFFRLIIYLNDLIKKTKSELRLE